VYLSLLILDLNNNIPLPKNNIIEIKAVMVWLNNIILYISTFTIICINILKYNLQIQTDVYEPIQSMYIFYHLNLSNYIP